MASFFDRLFGRKDESSADLARERLKLVLVTDRSDISPDKLAQMQDEIIEVIKRYLNVTESQVHIKLEQRDRKNYLVANIPLIRNSPLTTTPDYVPATPAPEPGAPMAEVETPSPPAEPKASAPPAAPDGEAPPPTRRRSSSGSRKTSSAQASEKPSQST